jgi:hypothetical protein
MSDHLPSQTTLPDLMLRQKAGAWEECDESFFNLFFKRTRSPLQRALQIHSDLSPGRTHTDVVTINNYIFVWTK